MRSESRGITRREALRMLGITAAGAWLGTSASAAEKAVSQPDAAPLRTRTIPSSGEKLPVIGLGTWQTFDVGHDPAERKPVDDVLVRFRELGGKVVDSSPMYGRSEAVVGEIATQHRLQK